MCIRDSEDALQKVGPGNGFEAADIDQDDGEQRERHNDNGLACSFWAACPGTEE